jgi:S1-C subfamily serine protease
MQSWFRSHLASAVAGGLVVAGTFLVLGVTGRRSTQTIVEQGPLMARQAASTSSALTPHAIYVRAARGTVFVRAYSARNRTTSTGTGFLADSHGDILTTYGVIAGASGVAVQFADQNIRRATVLAQDADDDVAVLRVQGSAPALVRPLTLGDSTTVRVGDPVLAVGDPFGYDRTLTSGIVSALQQRITDPNGLSVANVIQTDAPVSPGSVGGPLLDADGRVIGITGSGAGGAISFAVPIDTAGTLLDRVQTG